MYSPATAGLVRTGIVGMSGKAYQWEEEEMRGIGEVLGGQVLCVLWDGRGLLGQERVGRAGRRKKRGRCGPDHHRAGW